ncbi:hypothetical protein OTK49_02245 [Vibrio coralliirubri]|uniref:hypothetical protein n=1 Tax=Vibrio coralliirubri TaxID=1516159 RepID=UPI002283AA13|nr:hypothetical protein [Vibrio coralliirubri]MCY9861336.1 hypothetical protein [Vibrio coralliirubri]
MKEFDCLLAKVSEIESFIELSANDCNVKVESESSIYSMEHISDAEIVALLNLELILPSGGCVLATIEVIYDYFGFVGIHMKPTDQHQRFGAKSRRAKGSLNRVIKSFINQLIAIEGVYRNSLMSI